MNGILKTINLLGFKITYTVGDPSDTTVELTGSGGLGPYELTALIDELSRVSYEIEQGLE